MVLRNCRLLFLAFNGRFCTFSSFSHKKAQKNKKNRRQRTVRAVVTAIFQIILPANCNEIIAHFRQNVNRAFSSYYLYKPRFCAFLRYFLPFCKSFGNQRNLSKYSHAPSRFFRAFLCFSCLSPILVKSRYFLRVFSYFLHF